LAQACGVAREWTDVEGRGRWWATTALAAVLTALGHDAASERQIARSLAARRGTQQRPACDAGGR
jgi:4-alpha-glucanotransferase